MKQYFLLFILCALNFSCQAQTTSTFTKINKIYIDGDGGWDYLVVDTVNEHLFVSHSSVVNVIDLTTQKEIFTIKDLAGVHGIALAYDLNKGFITNGKDSSVTVFDMKTFATITKVSVTGKGPDAILYDIFSHHIFTFNGHGENITVIDAKENKVLATITLDGKPEFAVSDEAGKIYFNMEDKSMIYEVNVSTNIVENKWKTEGGTSPSGLTIDNANHILFSVCDNNKMVIMNAQNGKVIMTLPIGSSPDGVVFDPSTKMIYSSNGEGNITAVKENSATDFVVASTITTEKWARTIALDAKSHKLYLPTKEVDESTMKKDSKPYSIPGKFVVLEVGE